jgi:hypothetical protein
MEHTSSVLALASALLLADGGDVRLEVPDGGFAERRAAAVWSRSLQITEQTPDPRTRASSTTSKAAPPAARAGRFRLLTYNVAGLPQIVSKSRPVQNAPLVSALLNLYDMALVQEDFSYHSLLSARSLHAYRSEPMLATRSLVSDGLSYFSRFAFAGLSRVRWRRCNGYVSAASDCLADKGFSHTRVALAPELSVDVYNLHADAGGTRPDADARQHNFEQLAEYMQANSRDNAVIVAGDTNLRMVNPRDAVTLSRFLDATQLRDVCRSVRCAEERVDRVLIRSSAALELSPLGWWKDSHFVDARGVPLSDHPAIGVELSFRGLVPAALVAGR